MGRIFRSTFVALALMALIVSSARSDDNPDTPSDGKRPPTFFLSNYDSGFEIGTLQEGVKYCTDADSKLQQLPAEMVGLSFSRRKSVKPGRVTYHADPRTTVYAILDTDANATSAELIALHKHFIDAQWTRLEDIKCVTGGNTTMLAVYRNTEAGSAFHTFTKVGDLNLSFASKTMRAGAPPFCTFTMDAPWEGSVGVVYPGSDTDIVSLSEQAKYFNDSNSVLGHLPKEAAGASFARRASGKTSPVVIEAGPTSKIFLLFDSDNGPNGKNENVMDALQLLNEQGWTRLDDTSIINGKTVLPLAVFELQPKSNVTIGFESSGPSGIVVAGNNLKLTSISTSVAVNHAPPRTNRPPVRTPRTPPEPEIIDEAEETVTGAGPATQISRKQSSIKALYVIEQENGSMLGIASDYIVTATPSAGSPTTKVKFATPVGHEMHLVLQDVLRSICVDYPKWDASKVELSFEDKYTAKDGGSIGAATGTLLLSVIKGFEIDPHLAMTGDVSAEGKVRKIGGVAAKLRGATAAECTIMAIPQDNYDQVIDTLLYSGPQTVLDMQIIGISNLTEAVAVARTDRDEKLARGIALFEEIQESNKKTPDYFRSKAGQDKLAKVLSLVPHHLSAKLLLSVAQDKQRKTLSAAASGYYAYIAVETIMPILDEQEESRIKSDTTPTVVTEGLKKLKLLRPLADPVVDPLIGAWIEYINGLNDLNTGKTTMKLLEVKKQALRDEMEKLQANQELAEKMLHEGV